MDDGAGTVVMDMTTQAWHGTRSTGATLVPGFIGAGALRFNGTTGDVTIPDAAPRGDAIAIYMDMGSGVVSNRVNIAIQ